MRGILIAVALIWLALMPALFTDGTCTAEFEAVSARTEADAAQLRTPVLAQAYWAAQGVPVSVVTPEQCRRVKPRFLQRCGDGALVLAAVPVRNRVCRFYRDDHVSVQLHYDARGGLARVITDMAPYKALPLPFSERSLYWAR